MKQKQDKHGRVCNELDASLPPSVLILCNAVYMYNCKKQLMYKKLAVTVIVLANTLVKSIRQSFFNSSNSTRLCQF